MLPNEAYNKFYPSVNVCDGRRNRTREKSESQA